MKLSQNFISTSKFLLILAKEPFVIFKIGLKNRSKI